MIIKINILINFLYKHFYLIILFFLNKLNLNLEKQFKK